MLLSESFLVKFVTPRTVIVSVVGALAIWGMSHWFAEPGSRVRVLWGLTEYTKAQRQQFDFDPLGNRTEADVVRRDDLSAQSLSGFALGQNPEQDFLPEQLFWLGSSAFENRDDAFQIIADEFKLHPLDYLENDKPGTEVPHSAIFYCSIYFTVAVIAIVDSVNDPLSVLCVRMQDGSLHVALFVDDQTRNQINSLDARNSNLVTGFSSVHKDANNLILIPLRRIESLRDRTLRSDEFRFKAYDLQIR